MASWKNDGTKWWIFQQAIASHSKPCLIAGWYFVPSIKSGLFGGLMGYPSMGRTVSVAPQETLL